MDITQRIRQTKKRLLQMHFDSQTGHIASDLSCLDTLMVYYHQVKKADDRFILSKGHAAGALYATLWSLQLLSEQELRSFQQNGSRLTGHPSGGWHTEIPFTTGSLGHGLALAAGVATGKKLNKHPGRVFCLTSDGEWESGATWESIHFIAHHQLHQVTTLIDFNGLQAFGSTQSIAGLSALPARLKTLNLHITEINGHNSDQLQQALSCEYAIPHVIILLTVKGNGISYMENQLQWHYHKLNQSLLDQALAEL